MRWYLGILAVVIFLAASAMSWGHSMRFFADNGFGGGYDPLFGVVLLECLFLMGAGAELYNQKNGRKSTLSIKLALWGGGGVVLWANLRYGWDHGIEGVTAGLVVVAALLVAESILADIFLAARKAAGDHPDTVGEIPTTGEDSPNKMGGIPTTGEDSPNDLGEIREIVGEDLGEVGETTQQAGDHPGGEPGEIPATEEGSPKEPGWIQETGEEIPEESPKEQKAVGDHPEIRVPVGDPPKPKRFTQEEIEEMAKQIHKEGDSPTKGEIMAKFSISDHYARKVMKALKALKTQGGMEGGENEKDRKPARISTPAHGKQSNSHFTTDNSTEENQVIRPGA